MFVKQVRLNRTRVLVNYTDGAASVPYSCKDRPRPEFRTAIAALVPVILAIVHLPESYAEGLTPTGLTISEKQGARQVRITYTKVFSDGGGPQNITTCPRYMEHPEEEGTYSPSLSDEQNAIIESLIEEGKLYIKGEREQGQLPFPDKPEDEQKPAEPDALNFGSGPAGVEGDKLQADQARDEAMAEASTPAAKRPRGRPKGSSNKVPPVIPMQPAAGGPLAGQG